MFTKPKGKKRAAAGRQIMQPAAVTPYAPAAWAPRPGRGRARRAPALRLTGGRAAALLFAALFLAANTWLVVRINRTEGEIAALRGRIAALNAEKERLSARIARLGERGRVERLAASLGLFPPAAAQKDELDTR